jgi:hypothetical protein
MPIKAYGLRPIRHLNNAELASTEMTIASGYATAIYSGDPVTRIGDGTITQAAAGGVIIGVFDGVLFTDPSGEIRFSRYWPAGQVATTIKAFVYDDPKIVYSCFDDAVGDFLTAADCGGSGDIIVAAGIPATGWSQVTLQTSNVSATSGQLKIRDKVDRTGNEWATANGQQVEVEVIINEHFYELAAGI